MRSRSVDRERGSATAELAVALPAVALVLAACLAAIQLGAQQVRLADAAADAARALARGESVDTAAGIADRVSGGAALDVSRDGQFVCAVLRSSGAGLMSAIEVRSESCAVDGGR